MRPQVRLEFPRHGALWPSATLQNSPLGRPSIEQIEGDTVELVADFEKQYHAGPLIRFKLRRPEDAFSLTVLFGPSGSGKTTALRCIAGLERPDRGYIRFGNETWFDSERDIFVPPQKRRVGYLFQDYALFPHLTVARNIGHGLRGISRAERAQHVDRIMRVLGLTGLADRYPRQISGGQQQRVALARAVVCRPRMLLLDEPLSALDAPTRDQLRGQLRHSLEELRTPGLLVTHDRMDALALGDHMVVLENGRVCQSGSVHEVFSKPADLTVARIVGVDTVECAKLVEMANGLATVRVGTVELTAVASSQIDEEAYICIHAEDVILKKPDLLPQTSARNCLAGRIHSLDREGPMMRVMLDCGFPLKALVTKQACEEMRLQEGDAVQALVKATSIHLVPRGKLDIHAPG